MIYSWLQLQLVHKRIRVQHAALQMFLEFQKDANGIYLRWVAIVGFLYDKSQKTINCLGDFKPNQNPMYD